MVVYGASTKPYPVSGGGVELRSNDSVWQVPAGAGSNAVAPGSFTVRDTSSGGQTAYASNGQTIDFWIENLTNVNGQAQDIQYLAGSTTGYFTGIPVARNTFWRVGEDADGGALQDTASGGYVNLLVVAPAAPSTINVGYGEAVPNILIDSSSFTTTITGKSWKIVQPMNLYGYTAGQPREWLITPSNAMTCNQTL